MLSIDGTQRSQLREYVTWFQNHVANELVRVIVDEVPAGGPLEEFTPVHRAVEALQNDLSKQPVDGPASLIDDVLPAVKRVLLARRAAVAAEIEQQRSRTMHHELLSNLDKRLQAFDHILQKSELSRVRPLAIPKLADFLTVERLAQLQQTKRPVSARQYDDKFHILQVPGQFLSDLRQARAECEMRGRSVAVCYIDIDDFKTKFNSEMGESAVDRHVLPRFMQEIERTVFSHGHAYRFGGDEYVVLLPNQKREWALSLMEDLRSALAGLSFRGTAQHTTVSIGVAVVGSDTPLTEQEVQQKANLAKSFAKANGKNCIATFSNGDLTEGTLAVVPRD